MTDIVCYGDSNTWGSIPGQPGRFSKDERWTKRLQSLFGSECEIISEGQPGRTTCLDDPEATGRNGMSYLVPCLESHVPDFVILLLGTNDLKACFNLNAREIADGAGTLVHQIQQFDNRSIKNPPKALLVAPPVVYEAGEYAEMFAGAAEKSRHLGEAYRSIAEDMKCYFFDAAKVIQSSHVDGIHWDKDQHATFARSLFEYLQTILRSNQ